MGDRRFEPALQVVKQAADRAGALRNLSDDAVVSALAASAREADPYLSNVLATEAHNRFLRLRAVTDSMQDGVFVADVEGAPLYVNPAMERMFEAPGDALLRRDAPIHVSPEEEARYRRLVREALTRDGVGHVEYEMRRLGGASFWTEQTITPLRDVAGRLAGYVGIVRDVSEAHAVRERLRAKGALLDVLFAAVRDPVVVLDGAFRVVRASASFAERLGRSPESLVGARLGDVLPDTTDEERDVLREVLATGRSFESYAQRDAEGRPWDWHATPLPGPEGRPSGVVLWFRDATRRREGARGFVPA